MEKDNVKLLASKKRKLKIFTLITIIVEVLVVLTIVLRIYGYSVASFIFDLTPSTHVEGPSEEIEFKSKIDLGQDSDGYYYSLAEIMYSTLDSDFVVLRSAEGYPDIIMTNREGDNHQINEYNFSTDIQCSDMSSMITTEAIDKYPQIYSEDGIYNFYMIDYDNDVLMSAQEQNMRKGLTNSLFVTEILGAVMLYALTPVMGVIGVLFIILQIVFTVRYNKLKMTLS